MHLEREWLPPGYALRDGSAWYLLPDRHSMVCSGHRALHQSHTQSNEGVGVSRAGRTSQVPRCSGTESHRDSCLPDGRTLRSDGECTQGIEQWRK